MWISRKFRSRQHITAIMVPIAIAAVKIMCHFSLFDVQVVLTILLTLHYAWHSVSHTDTNCPQRLNFAGIVCLQSGHSGLGKNMQLVWQWSCHISVSLLWHFVDLNLILLVRLKSFARIYTIIRWLLASNDATLFLARTCSLSGSNHATFSQNYVYNHARIRLAVIEARTCLESCHIDWGKNMQVLCLQSGCSNWADKHATEQH